MGFKLKTLDQHLNESALLLEGGAFGHMSHPFEDMSLSFGELKQMITLTLQGELNKEVTASEKLDGQALAVSYKDGRTIFARNKTDRKKYGEAAPGVKEIIQKFAGRGEISDAFEKTVVDLDAALNSISAKELEKLFGNGSTFMHVEIIYPATANVISYDVAKLFFLTMTSYDFDGNAISADNDGPKILLKKLQKINADLQKTFQISEPAAIKFPTHIDFSKDQKKFLNEVDKLQKKYKLNDTDTLGRYVELIFTDHINAEGKKVGYAVPGNVMNVLNQRWVYGNKSTNIREVKGMIYNDKFEKWMLAFDKKPFNNFKKEAIYPIEIMILRLGALVMKNVSGFLAANPDKAVQNIVDSIKQTQKKLEKSKDIETLNKLNLQLQKIQDIGGFDAIVPSEGIVFVYKGKMYKFTGAFAPVNQINGILKFGR